MAWALYLLGREPHYPLREWAPFLDKGGMSPGVEPRFIGYLARSLITVPTELSRHPYIDSYLY